MARRTLSNEVKQGILDGLKNGLRPADLAVTFGVSIPTVYNFKNRAAAAEANTNVALSGFATPAEVGTVTVPVATRTARKSTKASR